MWRTVYYQISVSEASRLKNWDIDTYTSLSAILLSLEPRYTGNTIYSRKRSSSFLMPLNCPLGKKLLSLQNVNKKNKQTFALRELKQYKKLNPTNEKTFW